MIAWTIYITFAGAVVLLFMPCIFARWIALATTAIGLVVGLAAFFVNDVDLAHFNTIVRIPWVPMLGMNYHLAVDGISLTMVLVTGLVAIASVIRGSATAVSRDGKLLGMDIEFVIDGGAYATLSAVVLSRGTIHAAGPYECANVRIRSRAMATNTPPHGAFRHIVAVGEGVALALDGPKAPAAVRRRCGGFYRAASAGFDRCRTGRPPGLRLPARDKGNPRDAGRSGYRID